MLNILPLNHCLYYENQFDGGYTYFKADKKSQIDFILTNNAGRRNVCDLKLMTSGWHFSDHLPIDVSVRATFNIDPLAIYIRSKALTLCTDISNKSTLKFCRNEFDAEAAKEIMTANAADISRKCHDSQYVEPIVSNLHSFLQTTIKQTSYARRPQNIDENDATMAECDQLFSYYLQELKRIPCDAIRTRESYRVYQEKRNELNGKWRTAIHQKYTNIATTGDSKELWRTIDWSGNFTKSAPLNHPSTDELSEHFTTLYEPIVNDGNLESLKSDSYVPATDDPITNEEINSASKQMKKGGYDFPIIILQLLLTTLGGVIHLLMNKILYSNFPANLCISLLAAIPKFGNLRISTNYRGIQMQPLLANLYDRILANRLLTTVKINDEQTAFQKGKSTIDQIFLLRVIISLIKVNKLTLYVGFFQSIRPRFQISAPKTAG